MSPAPSSDAPAGAKPVLLLADLHLPAGPSPFRDAFLRFCAGPAREASAVYILGDLFEYWIGDDVGREIYADEIAALRALTGAGVRVFFAHGNRDFLVGPGFFDASGVELLDDPARLELAGDPTLLSHGDEFCTDDVAYQRWRRFCRNKTAQGIFRKLPRGLRERIAGRVRRTSLVEKRMKAEDIMDVNDAAVGAAFDRHRVRRIIHGHTHRPQAHRHGERERVVLADWRPERMEYLRVDAAGIRRITLA